MNSESKTTLMDYLECITYGFTNPMSDTEEGPWKVTAKDIVDGEINFKTARHTSQIEYDNLTDKSKPIVGDVLLTKDGTLGRLAVVDVENICINQSVALLRPKSCLNPYYLKYLLSSDYYQQLMISDASGSTIHHIYITRIDKMGVHIPPLDKQLEILDVLFLIDGKIKNNNTINAELESLAKTIYDYWFLQFEFPNEEGLPYKSSGGRMVWSEELKREIPEGWGCTKIRDVLAKIPKTTHINTTDYLEFGSIPIIDQSENIIAGYTNDKSSQITLNIGCTVFGDHTRVVKYICFPFARGADGTQILKSNTLRIPDILLYQIVKHIDLSNYGYARHFKFLKDTNVILPNESISNKYVNIVSSMYEMQAKFIFENHELAALRDWLLPMLMNGQVGFKEEGESI